MRLSRVVYLCFLEARPAVQGVFALRFLAGASFADTLFIWEPWAGLIVWSLAAWAIYLLNGVTDIREDRINRSTRPIARGELGAEQALAVVVGLVVLNLACAAAAGFPPLWGTALFFALGWAYSSPPLRLKRWPVGLATVAVTGGLLTYYAGYRSNGGENDILPVIVFAAVMALWMGLVGQTKDLSDVQGDAETGRRSLPITWGDRETRLTLSGIALALGLVFLLSAVFFVPGLLVPAIVLAVGSVGVTALVLRSQEGERKDRRKPYQAFMLTQYGTHLTVIILWNA